MRVFSTLTLSILLVLASQSLYAQTVAKPTFDEYKLTVYQGKLTLPAWIDKRSETEWRDELGKVVDAPEINFAGKYYLAGHSCGTGCRYYTLTDLTDGKGLEILGGFASAEPPPKTREGNPYISLLFTEPDSNLLIVQYQIAKGNETECRERSYLFVGSKLRPLTKTIAGCRNL